jgi:serine protease Do
MREKVINIIVILIVIGLTITGTLYFTKKNTVSSVVNKNVNVTEKDSINESVKKVYDAVVVVNNYQNGSLTGYGSGFVYKKDDKYGYIMTNNHVVSDASSIKVTLSSGKEIEAKILGTDTYMDIAVLRISASDVLGVAEIGDSTKTKIGDTIFTVGTPVSKDYAGTVTKGIISGENREITITNNGSQYMMEAIQIDASINPGNSGGPLVNIDGQVIGVNSVKLVQSSVESMGFAIPIEVAMSQVSKLENGEKIARPVIGITLYNNNSSLTDDSKTGVVVGEVSKDSDAETAGLQANDTIIKLDGVTVKNAAHLKYLLYKHNIGDTVKLTITRDGKEKELTLKLTHQIGD